MKQNISIYALVDPRNNELRYIGQTFRVESRLREHLAGAHKTTTRVALWIQDLVSCQTKPEMVILEDGVSHNLGKDVESFWISYFRSLGARMLNAHGVPENMKWDRHPPDSLLPR